MQGPNLNTTLNTSSQLINQSNHAQLDAASEQGVSGGHTIQQGQASTPQPRSETLARTPQSTLQRLGNFFKRLIVPQALRTETRVTRAAENLKESLISGNTKDTKKNMEKFFALTERMFAKNADYQTDLTSKFNDIFKGEKPSVVEKIRAGIYNEAISRETESSGNNEIYTLLKKSVDSAFGEFRNEAVSNKNVYIDSLKEQLNSGASFKTNDEAVGFIAKNISLFREAISVEVMEQRMASGASDSDVVASEAGDTCKNILEKMFQDLAGTNSIDLLAKHEFWGDVGDAFPTADSSQEGEAQNTVLAENLRTFKHVTEALSELSKPHAQVDPNSYKSKLAQVNKETSRLDAEIKVLQDEMIKISNAIKLAKDGNNSEELKRLSDEKTAIGTKMSALSQDFSKAVSAERLLKAPIEEQHEKDLLDIKESILKNLNQ